MTKDEVMRLADALEFATGQTRHEALMPAAAALRKLHAENEALRRSDSSFAGWFTELRSGMSYRLWEQGGADWEPGYVALYTRS
jgi:hypothetical protein